MRKIIFLWMLWQTAHAQVFKPGVYKTHSGEEKKGVFGLKADAPLVPQSWLLINTAAGIDSVSLQNIASFQFEGEGKYVSDTVYVEYALNEVGALNRGRKPQQRQEVMFLQELFVGKAKLYEYRSEQYRRYFYQLPGQPKQQLICYQYLDAETQATGSNRAYIHQLYHNIPLPEQNLELLMGLQYTSEDLVEYFKRYDKGESAKNRFRSSNMAQEAQRITLRWGGSSGLGYDYTLLVTKDKEEYEYSEKHLLYYLGLSVEAEYCVVRHRPKLPRVLVGLQLTPAFNKSFNFWRMGLPYSVVGLRVPIIDAKASTFLVDVTYQYNLQGYIDGPTATGKYWKGHFVGNDLKDQGTGYFHLGLSLRTKKNQFMLQVNPIRGSAASTMINPSNQTIVGIGTKFATFYYLMRF